MGMIVEAFATLPCVRRQKTDILNRGNRLVSPAWQNRNQMQYAEDLWTFQFPAHSILTL